LPSGSDAAKALESPLNLLSIVFGQIYFPTYSNALKDLARWLGFNWSDQDASGPPLDHLRDQWEHTKTPLIKEKLITYNLEDCSALELVSSTVSQAYQLSIGQTRRRRA